MAKHLWTACNEPESLRAQGAKEKLKGVNTCAASIPQGCSWSGRKMLQLRPLLKHNIRMEVGDGHQTSLFYYCWLGETRLEEVDGLTQDIAAWGHALLLPHWISRSI